MSCYHGSQISGSQQSFLTEAAICIIKDKRKIWATVLLLSAIMHSKVIHVKIFFSFSAIIVDHGLLRSQKILLPWQHDLTIIFLLSISSTTNSKVGKGAHEPKAQMARAYTSFCSMKHN